MAERIGVAGALTIASDIFEVTEADFRRIDPTPKAKTFDYDLQLEALGPDYDLVVEAKGTHDGKSTRHHIESIRAKKAEATVRRKTFRFGQHQHEAIASSWALSPPASPRAAASRSTRSTWLAKLVRDITEVVVNATCGYPVASVRCSISTGTLNASSSDLWGNVLPMVDWFEHCNEAVLPFSAMQGNRHGWRLSALRAWHCSSGTRTCA